MVNKELSLLGCRRASKRRSWRTRPECSSTEPTTYTLSPAAETRRCRLVFCITLICTTSCRILSSASAIPGSQKAVLIYRPPLRHRSPREQGGTTRGRSSTLFAPRRAVQVKRCVVNFIDVITRCPKSGRGRNQRPYKRYNRHLNRVLI